ncbi:HAD family phosphatase [Actinotalea sp. K2]|uniref:HAD family hydrolase n=1 Tax=Actinotalea sp. K2 TaxID=2939438 RepID=UPI0020171FD8|nr:HAD family phosphatase [Actinotalea sp. K2]MCL3861896.1 HAD family phosphatase [Actinotalea sp. K2]
MTPRPDGGTAGRSHDPTGTLPAAVLWDMDGTLVDTEPSWMAAEAALVGEHGGEWTEHDALQMIGLPLPAAAKILQGHGVDLPVEVITERLVDGVSEAISRHVEWQPGALELLVALRHAGVPCALVTMSYRRLAATVVAAAPQGSFAAVVTGDEVTFGKPHPEPYLRAAQMLGVDVRECVAIEDSPPGIGSALAAGASTLGVEHIAPVVAAPGLSRVGSLAEIDLGDLARIASGEVIDLLVRSGA